jgi:hypothetical protein
VSAAHLDSISILLIKNAYAMMAFSTIRLLKNVCLASDQEFGMKKPTHAYVLTARHIEILLLETADPAPLTCSSTTAKLALVARLIPSTAQDADAAAAVLQE